MVGGHRAAGRLGLPTLIGYLTEGSIGALAGLLVGGVTRLVAVHHMTFFINSLATRSAASPTRLAVPRATVG